MELTKRGVIDLGRSCHLRCEHCFHKYSDDKNYGYEHRKFKPVKEIEAEVELLVENKRTAVALTGGEPLLHPELHYILDLCMTEGLRPEIITAGLPRRVKAVVNRYGPDKIDWLFSIHGAPIMHDYITGSDDAWNNFLLSLLYIGDSNYRLNCVIMSYNWHSLLELFNLYFPIIFEALDYKTPFTEPLELPKPKEINLIKWRPFYAWMDEKHEEEVKRTLYPDAMSGRLNRVISEASEFTDTINLRYFKKCGYASGKLINYWSTINYMYDPWEWLNENIPESSAKGIMLGKWMKRCYYKDDGICKDCAMKPDCEGFLKGYE